MPLYEGTSGSPPARDKTGSGRAGFMRIRKAGSAELF